ncbi:MAG: Serine/threonine-protein kinase PAK 3 [Marteilia pararefringens]
MSNLGDCLIFCLAGINGSSQISLNLIFSYLKKSLEPARYIFKDAGLFWQNILKAYSTVLFDNPIPSNTKSKIREEKIKEKTETSQDVEKFFVNVKNKTLPVLGARRNRTSITTLLLCFEEYLSYKYNVYGNKLHLVDDTPSDISETNNNDQKGENNKSLPPIRRRKPQKIQERLTNDQAIERLNKITSPEEVTAVYSIKELLGEGGSGKVYRAIKKNTNEIHAVKQMLLAEQTKLEQLVLEIEIMKSLNHPNLVNFIGSYMTNHDMLWVCIEILEGGDLTGIVTQAILNEKQISYITECSLKGLEYLHMNNIMHRDIKSDNILLGKNNEVKVTDFGFCAKTGGESSKRSTVVGTPYWMAPEVIRNEKYTNTIDSWSIGITVIEMVDGEPPHMDLDPIMALRVIASCENKPTCSDVTSISKELQQFIDRCCETDGSLRSTCKDLLKDDFIRLTKHESEYDLREAVKLAVQQNDDY